MQEAFGAASEDFKIMMQKGVDDDPSMTEILIVDDEMINIDVATGLLFSQNISSSYALSGKTALEKIEERIDLIKQSEGLGDSGPKMFKLILLDYCMPMMDGIQCAQKIRKLCNVRGIK